MTLPSPPPKLEKAIERAAKRYDVPEDLLVGFWHTESASSFPNPYANGLGYGGEFGTQIVPPFGPASQVRHVTEPPVQQQADLSASILHNLLVENGGNISAALEAYSGGSYRSVPGETTFGVVPIGQGTVLEPAYHTKAAKVAAQKAGQEKATGSSQQPAPAVTPQGQPAGFFPPGFFSPSGAWHTLTGGVTSVVHSAEGLAAFFAALLKVNTWIRVGLVLAGGIVIFIGVRALVS